mgnify:CR=1 FL=1
MNSRKIKLTIESDLDNVTLIGESVRTFCLMIPLTNLNALRMQLCVTEVVSNVIKHAYNNEKNHEIEVEFYMDTEKIVISIFDTGAPIEENILEETDDKASMSELREGGRGLFLIQTIMDSVDISRVDNKNKWTLTKHISKDLKND